MSRRGWLTQAWNYHQGCIDTLLLSYSRLTLANAHFPDVNVVLQLIHATLYCYFRLGDADWASSLGARVLSKQIRSAFVPILYLSPIAKSAPHFTSRLPKPGRGEQELQCSLGKVQTELRNVVEE
jgi:hypothetical protein